jgi:hypothetical protein
MILKTLFVKIQLRATRCLKHPGSDTTLLTFIILTC